MNALKLNIPAQELDGLKSLDPAPKTLNAWLDALHSADIEKSAERVLDVIRKYNRCQIPPAIRYQSLITLLPIVSEYKEALRGKFRGNPFPLVEKYRIKAELVSHLMQELASGFKIVVSDAADGEKNLKTTGKILLHSIYFAIFYLGESLLNSYLVYMPEPEGLWGEVNRLYKFAEEKGLHNKEIVLEKNNKIKSNTIIQLFKKILLLHIADPYHLMEGEATKVYRLLDEWVSYSRVDPFKGADSLVGNFYVDLNSDGPPKFAVSDLKHEPKLGGTLGLGKLLSHLSDLLINHGQSDATVAAPLKLKDRMHRDMLMRLKRVWGGKLERTNNRSPEKDKILLTAGLTTSHHFISNEDPFVPERDEIRFYKPDGVSKGLSLLPADVQPWLMNALEEKLETGVTQPRTSLFDIESADVDAWEKIYSTEARSRLILDSKEPDFTAQIWEQRNTSGGGMGLVRENPCGIRVWVGDLVAYKFCDHDLQGWYVGTVRWLRDIKSETLELGVMMIADNARPVSVRAIGGIGKGGEYFRSLTINKKEHDQDKTTLIVPANIYDAGTELAFNTNKNISYIRLIKIVETTNTFTEFEYIEIEIPENEKENIAAMRGA